MLEVFNIPDKSSHNLDKSYRVRSSQTNELVMDSVGREKKMSAQQRFFSPLYVRKKKKIEVV